MKRSKPYWEMNVQELAAATREFDDPANQPKARRPSAQEKAQHDRILRAIKRKRGRPQIGAGSMRIQVTMERGLLQQVDQYARAHNVTRSELLARGVTHVLSGAA